MISKNIVRIAILSLTFGIWEVYLKNAYYGYITDQGKPLGVAEVSLGYFVVLATAYIVSWWIVRRLGMGEAVQ